MSFHGKKIKLLYDSCIITVNMSQSYKAKDLQKSVRKFFNIPVCWKEILVIVQNLCLLI